METFQVWHEINNSLTAVNLTLESLQRESGGLSSQEIREELTFSLLSLEHVRNVIKSEKIEAYFVVSEVLQTATKILGRKWPNSSLTLPQNSPDLELYGDKTAFTQVIMNLITNALESYENKPHPGKLKVKLMVKKLPLHRLSISIRDWGQGIPASAQNQIFQEFFTLRRVQGGSGIGLALCRQIIEEQFDGSISCQSEVGKGSVFTIELPTRYIPSNPRSVQ